MARERRRQPTPPQGFIASAVRLPSSNNNDIGKPQAWQKQAWEFYNAIPELRYVSNWIGNVMARAEWHVAKRRGTQLDILTSGPAHESLLALYGGRQGQQQMTQLLGTDLTVGGEGFIVAHDDDWDVLTTGKVTRKSKTDKTMMIDFGEGAVPAKRNDLIIRVWTPHPTDAKTSDAPTRSNLRTMSQIAAYDDHIGAQLTSRLAGAGILLMPSEIEFAADDDADPEATQADALMSKLHEAMMAAKEDRNSPAAFVPIVVTVPGELIQYAKHMTFWSDLDKAVIDMRDAAIRRFGIGMDVPPEVLLGNAESNHWNAWLSEESAIKAHLEPRLSVIAHALTTQYLRPSLVGTDLESQADDYFVVADTAPIRTRPNRAQEALELRDKGLLAGNVVLTETGFHPNDAMGEEERVRWLMERVALGAVPPEITAEALRFLGAPIVATGNEPQDQPTTQKVDTVVEEDERVPPDQAEREAVARQEQERALAAASEVLVFRALERAGNKLKNAHKLNGAAPEVDSIYLSHSGDHNDLLINLQLDVPPFFSRFQRVAEVVTQDDASLTALRQSWKFYKDRGYQLEKHDL